MTKQSWLTRAFLCAFAILPLYLYAAKEDEQGRRNGFISTLYIGSEYMIYRAGGDGFNGVKSSLNVGLGWIWRDYVKTDIYAGIGLAPVEARGSYPLQATALAPTLSFSRGVSGDILFGSRLGFNISSLFNYWQHALYLHLGLDSLSHSNAFLGSAYSSGHVFTIWFLELDGRAKINQKWALEYTARAGIGSAIVQYLGDLTKSGKDLQVSSSAYSFGGSVGAQYKLGTRAYFFARLNATYLNAAQMPSKALTTNATPELPTTTANATLNLAYPATHILYTGMQFGFGF